MTSLIVTLLILVMGASLLGYKAHKDRSAGKKEEKLKQAEKVIKNAKKAKDAVARLDDDKRKRLRGRYKRK